MMTDKRLAEMKQEIERDDRATRDGWASIKGTPASKSWFVNALRDAVAEIEELRARDERTAEALRAAEKWIDRMHLSWKPPPGALVKVREALARLGLAVLLALTVTACGQPLDVDLSGVPEEHRAEVAARLDRVVETGLAWWGAERSDLDGWRVEFVESFANSSYMGLTWYDSKLIQLRLPPDYARDPNVCGELLLLYLPHEIGHAVGNRSHSGARWAREFEVLRAMVAENPACDDRGAL